MLKQIKHFSSEFKPLFYQVCAFLSSVATTIIGKLHNLVSMNIFIAIFAILIVIVYNGNLTSSTLPLPKFCNSKSVLKQDISDFELQIDKIQILKITIFFLIGIEILSILLVKCISSVKFLPFNANLNIQYQILMSEPPVKYNTLFLLFCLTTDSLEAMIIQSDASLHHFYARALENILLYVINIIKIPICFIKILLPLYLLYIFVDETCLVLPLVPSWVFLIPKACLLFYLLKSSTHWIYILTMIKKMR